MEVKSFGIYYLAIFLVTRISCVGRWDEVDVFAGEVLRDEVDVSVGEVLRNDIDVFAGEVLVDEVDALAGGMLLPISTSIYDQKENKGRFLTSALASVLDFKKSSWHENSQHWSRQYDIFSQFP